MHPSQLLRSAPLLALLLLGCGPGPKDAPPPNVVLVVIDTLRADKLSTYGYPLDTSPALTRLAEQGVQFDAVTAQTSWTLPSVGSLLTSRYPRNLGLYEEDAQKLPDTAETLAETLSRAGYTTFGITANPNLNSRYNFQQGFDRYLDSVVVFRKSRDLVPEDKVFFKDHPLRKAPEVFGDTLEFVDGSEGAFPYFIQMDLMEVHEYFNGTLMREKYADLFSEDPSANYLRMIRQVTDDLERFVHELTSRPGWENTLFVITSDHGEGLTDHPAVASSRGHGALLYASHVHVPWILYDPSWTPERHRIEQRVRLLDLVPTVLDYVGLEPAPEAVGVSLLPLIEGEVEAVPMPEYLITETYFRELHKVSAIGKQWQFVHNLKEHKGLPEIELQAWNGKPNGKLTDVGPSHPDEVARMNRFVEQWESSHRPAEPTPLDEELDDATRHQLEGIGYLGSDEKDE